MFKQTKLILSLSKDKDIFGIIHNLKQKRLISSSQELVGVIKRLKIKALSDSIYKNAVV